MKRFICMVCVYVIMLSGIYVGGVFYFQNRFMANTFINGYEVALDTYEEADQVLLEGAPQFFTVQEENNSTTIDLGKLESRKAIGLSAESVVKRIPNWRWPESFSNLQWYSLDTAYSYDQDELTNAVREYFPDEGRTDPVDAHIEENDEGFFIAPEQDGTKVNAKELSGAIIEKIEHNVYDLDMTQESHYLHPSVNQNDSALTLKVSDLNEFAARTITIDLGAGDQEVLNWGKLKGLVVHEEDGFVVDDEKLQEYISDLALRYSSFYTARSFHTTSGKDIRIGGGKRDTYGFWMDERNTMITLKNALAQEGSQTVEPVWKAKARTRRQKNGDIGDTYVEVSIPSQHMWYYEEGKLVMDTPVVTGMMTPSRSTPDGVFRILNKARNHTMHGSYGTAFCQYWLPVTWDGVGIHDASWRSTYGGTIYVNDGSHGCINTPLSQVSFLYERVSIGTPVIIHNEQ